MDELAAGRINRRTYGKHSHEPEEECPREGDAPLYLREVFLGSLTHGHTRDACALPLEAFAIILLLEEHIRVEEGERHNQDKVDQRVEGSLPAKGVVDSVGEVGHPRY